MTDPGFSSPLAHTADSMVRRLLLALGLPFHLYWKRSMLRQAA